MLYDHTLTDLGNGVYSIEQVCKNDYFSSVEWEIHVVYFMDLSNPTADEIALHEMLFPPSMPPQSVWDEFLQRLMTRNFC